MKCNGSQTGNFCWTWFSSLPLIFINLPIKRADSRLKNRNFSYHRMNFRGRWNEVEVGMTKICMTRNEFHMVDCWVENFQCSTQMLAKSHHFSQCVKGNLLPTPCEKRKKEKSPLTMNLTSHSRQPRNDLVVMDWY